MRCKQPIMLGATQVAETHGATEAYPRLYAARANPLEVEEVRVARDKQEVRAARDTQAVGASALIEKCSHASVFLGRRCYNNPSTRTGTGKSVVLPGIQCKSTIYCWLLAREKLVWNCSFWAIFLVRRSLELWKIINYLP